jgi:hypothetical protein
VRQRNCAPPPTLEGVDPGGEPYCIEFPNPAITGITIANCMCRLTALFLFAKGRQEDIVRTEIAEETTETGTKWQQKRLLHRHLDLQLKLVCCP